MGKRTDLKEKRLRKQRRNTIIVIAGIIIVVAAVFIIVIRESQQPTREIVIPETVDRPAELVSTEEMAIGDPNAPVTMEVYEDFQCSACGIYTQNIEPAIISQFVETGQVYYRFIPYSFMDERLEAEAYGESKRAAEAAFCALDQNRFWDYHDILYANQTGENIGDFTDERLTDFAEILGLEMTNFQQCMNDRTYQDEVLQIRQDGEERGLTGTPYFFVNGEAVVLQTSYNELVQAIDAALATR